MKRTDVCERRRAGEEHTDRRIQRDVTSPVDEADPQRRDDRNDRRADAGRHDVSVGALKRRREAGPGRASSGVPRTAAGVRGQGEGEARQEGSGESGGNQTEEDRLKNRLSHLGVCVFRVSGCGICRLQ